MFKSSQRDDSERLIRSVLSGEAWTDLNDSPRKTNDSPENTNDSPRKTIDNDLRKKLLETYINLQKEQSSYKQTRIKLLIKFLLCIITLIVFVILVYMITQFGADKKFYFILTIIFSCCVLIALRIITKNN